MRSAVWRASLRILRIYLRKRRKVSNGRTLSHPVSDKAVPGQRTALFGLTRLSPLRSVNREI